MVRTRQLALVSLACLVGCEMGMGFGGAGGGSFGDDGGNDGFDDRPVVRSAVMPPPISGGTLIVAADGDTVIASDPDRDLVHVVSVSAKSTVATIALEPGDEPGRLVEDADGTVHVVLRGAGAVATIDPRAGTVVARNDSCANPRGIAIDDGRGAIVVACAGGELVEHTPAGAITKRTNVGTDLRDVIVQNGVVKATRFRTGELLTVDGDGGVLDRVAPARTPGVREPGTAWRTRATPDGGWLMVHQSAVVHALSVEPSPFRSFGSYGGSPEPTDGAGNPPLFGCDGPVSGVLTMGRPSGEVVSSELLTFSTLPVDVALSPDGSRIALAIAGQHDADSETMERQRGLALVNAAMLSADPDPDCHDPEDIALDGHIVAVGFIDDDTVVAQSREPAALFVVQLDDRTSTRIELAGPSRFDTGHDLFHQDAGVGLSCASCHPEGGDDGRVWLFDPGTIPRRTQSLRIALGGTEPFHWSGDLDDFEMLTHEIHASRMGAAEQDEDRILAFRDWVFAIPTPRPERDATDELAQRGHEAFVQVGCEECHYEGALLDGKTAEVLGESFQIPSLTGIALRPPYMHDGRYADLAASVTGMLAETAPDQTLSPDDVAAVVAYLETL